MRDDQAQQGWSVDVAAPLQAVVDDPACPPLLRQALTGSISWQVRNETPVWRVLAVPRLAPRWVAGLLALGATLVVDGEEVPLSAGARFPRPDRRAGQTSHALHVRVGALRWGEAHVARTPADEPIVAAVAVVEMDQTTVRVARIALTGAWPEPARLAQAPAQLVGGPLDGERIRAVAAAVEQEVAPKGDFMGSREYRRAMAGVLTRRALEQCREGQR
jgi:CO/xanthine dehydrogenase FAD-binding subunit